MKKISTVILDDDKSCNELLQREAAKFVRLDVKKSFTEPRKFLDYMMEHTEIELAFLDQQMGNYQGLDLVEQLPENVQIVMVTGFDSFGYKAFTKDVVDFIVKPISYESLAIAVRKVERRMKLSSFWPETDYNNGYFTVSKYERGGKGKYMYNEVVYIQSAKDTCIIHCLNARTDKVSIRLGRLIADLPPAMFKRIHNEIIINKRYANTYCDAHITVRYEKNDKKLSVGPSFSAEIREWFNDRLIT